MQVAPLLYTLLVNEILINVPSKFHSMHIICKSLKAAIQSLTWYIIIVNQVAIVCSVVTDRDTYDSHTE
jgi:hypothetical protein